MSTAKPVLADAEARRRILTDFNTTLFVEAAAGTGKTTALVGRIVALICDGVSTLDRIVAVTFTEKAAGEMKLRLREEIERARNAKDITPERSGRLAKALSQLELARIGTIHAFCGDLLRERPVEAGIDPLFEVAAEDQAADLMDRAFETWFQNALANPSEGVRRILRRRSKSQQSRDVCRDEALAPNSPSSVSRLISSSISLFRLNGSRRHAVGKSRCSARLAAAVRSALPTLAADDSGGGLGVKMVFERHIVWPNGHREMEGVTPKQLPAPASHVLLGSDRRVSNSDDSDDKSDT